MKLSWFWSRPSETRPHRLAIEYGLGVPFLFTVLFLFTYPVPQSEGPITHRSLVPSVVVLCLGVIGWIAMLVPAIRALRHSGLGNRLSGLFALLAFGAFACELYLALYAIRKG